MIRDEIVGYDIAKLAKDNGFNEPTTLYYTADGVRMGCYAAVCHNFTYSYNIAAPTQSQLQRWLREKKGLHISIPLHKGEYKYFWGIDSLNRKEKEDDIAYNLFDTYELALENALKYALENLI